MRLCVQVAVLVATPWMCVAAQDAPALAAGQRVRITAPTLGLKRQVVTLDAVGGDTLLLGGDAVRAIPLTSVERLEVFEGRHGHPWRGAGVGFLVGAVTGAVLGPYTVPGEGDTAEGKAVAGAVLLGAAGALTGVVIGALIKTDKWEEVPLDGLRVSIATRGGGVGVGIRLGF
jgi:hypothetical protein